MIPIMNCAAKLHRMRHRYELCAELRESLPYAAHNLTPCAPISTLTLRHGPQTLVIQDSLLAYQPKGHGAYAAT